MKNRYTLTSAAFLLALSVILGGCGGSGGGSKNFAAETTAASYEVAGGAAYDMAVPAMASEDGYWMEEKGYEYETEAAAMSPDSGGLSDSSSMNPVNPSGRKLIRNVSMFVETDSFDQLVDQIRQKTAELSGYMEQSDISGNRASYSSRSAWMIIRIPSSKLDQFISLVEENGNVAHKSESVQDVTLQYSDLESRKKTLTVEQDRIWALLEKADTLEAVIALEERLSEIRYELESMESRLKLYDNQVEYSTVSVDINEVLPVNFTPTAPETVGQRIHKGFSRNIKNVKEFFINLFVGLIVLIPVWLPLGAIVLIILGAVRFFARKRLKRYGVSFPSQTGQSSEEAVTDTKQEDE